MHGCRGLMEARQTPITSSWGPLQAQPYRPSDQPGPASPPDSITRPAASPLSPGAARAACTVRCPAETPEAHLSDLTQSPVGGAARARASGLDKALHSHISSECAVPAP